MDKLSLKTQLLNNFRKLGTLPFVEQRLVQLTQNKSSDNFCVKIVPNNYQYPKSTSGEDKVMRNFVKNGDVVFDIGAHFGFYTLLLSELVGEKGKVFAFEPNSELLPSLKMTINSLANIELFSIALSDKEGAVNLFVPEDASMASLSDWTHGIAGNVHKVACVMKRLDDLIEEGIVSFPQFIKCDVEGAELSIFKGAPKILNRTDAPVILSENNALAAESFNANTADYFDFLESLESP